MAAVYLTVLAHITRPTNTITVNYESHKATLTESKKLERSKISLELAVFNTSVFVLS